MTADTLQRRTGAANEPSRIGISRLVEFDSWPARCAQNAPAPAVITQNSTRPACNNRDVAATHAVDSQNRSCDGPRVIYLDNGVMTRKEGDRN